MAWVRTPFTYTDVDFLRYVKEGCNEIKRYGVIFTYLISRALHLETAKSINISSFLNTLIWFISIRGPIWQLRSNRGTKKKNCEKQSIKWMKSASLSICWDVWRMKNDMMQPMTTWMTHIRVFLLAQTILQVVLPPPGEFSKPESYSGKRCRRVKYLANEF